MNDYRSKLAVELEILRDAFVEQGENMLSEKASTLMKKCRSETFYVAFCGHFSAGKSSLINDLCGAKLLPSSPIPTSANIVSIRSGSTEALLTYRDGSEARVPLEDVSIYALDGELVRTVELRHPIPLLGEHGVLLDTPGVDSTDDSHRQATESALHLADVVFYVMDYNHVLSEMNMEFAKRLSEMGKPLVLIVNQIDKHREEEGSLASFREGVNDAFRSWGVEPAACVYTSLKAPSHPHNEVRALRRLLGELVTNGASLATQGIAAAAVELVEEAQRGLRQRHEGRRSELLGLAAREDAEVVERYETVAAMLSERGSVRERLAERLRAEAAAIAENANITPATTRDAARSFLESRQPGFRVGLFFAAAKTEEERKRRLEAFCREFAEHVTARLVWHVRDHVKKAGRELGLDDPTVDAAAEAVHTDVTPEWLLSKVRSGAVVSGEYTLNYAKEIAGGVRQSVLRTAVEAAEKLADAAEAVYAGERQALMEEKTSLEAKLAHRRELEFLETAERKAKEEWMSLMPTASSLSRQSIKFPVVQALDSAANSGAEGAGSGGALALDSQEHKEMLDLSLAASGAGKAAGEPGDWRNRLADAAAILEAASKLVGELPPLVSATGALEEKARRLREQRFTAALFGAFSAGKSSFANALLGEAALPVSPNPTTAAINTVVPPTAEWPHGTARVIMKTQETVLADVRHSLQALGVLGASGTADADALLRLLQPLVKSSSEAPPGGKPHLAFLSAVSAGWAEAAPLLGTDIRADRALFRAYVAEERKSAFVDRIELHYESGLSRQGVTLVDTPGADSINARHTGVAFNYMKSADAIFFVTYYNHAFSRADRQFLEQLGRVKDAFELDKMFFIVNAADLASDAKELQDVLEHVRTNLAAFGVRNPRLFPVSSLKALEGKQEGNTALTSMSGMTAFEEQFARFAGGDLAGLAFRSAAGELKRTVGLLQTLLQGAKTDEEDRQAALEQLKVSEARARDRLAASDLESVRKDVLKETEEQLYYIKQRFQFRFGEWYNASFNPSVLREDRGDIKQALAWAWRDLIGYIQTELVNESLAASLRLERMMNRSVTAAVGRWNESLRRDTDAYEADEWEELSFSTPNIETVWTGEEPDVKLLSAQYKSARHFFENRGRTSLREALERRWQPQIAYSLDRVAARFTDWAESELVHAREAASEKLSRTLTVSMENARAAWEQPWDAVDLEERLQALRAYVLSFEASMRERQDLLPKTDNFHD
jgi:small GTP-binding protein